ncbi:uncharacterized protein LOC128860015 [Anastrepha ludens]|uniref:uncharacterized protein LOC128860015 n=1 Tax=Anastrepha ludens TaxID=28586 RepID=UPI0023AFE23C|nr:uncharacterized protein LOC128860015 [Anastrepha ludens]
MDEVDIDGEDFNELEARLYGQIHHEAVDATTVDVNNTTEIQAEGKVSVERIVTEKSVVNRPAKTHRVPDTRYWANSLNTSKLTNKPSETKHEATVSNDINLNRNITDNEKLSKNFTLETNESGVRTNENNAEVICKNESQSPNIGKVKKSEPLQPQKSETNNTPGNNLRINPTAVVKNSKLNLKKKKQEQVQRNGPFMQKETKLQKALLLQAKKKKSENVRNKKLKQKPELVSIVLDSSSDGDGETNKSDDDVVLIPAKPPPTITLSDSDNECSAFQLEENAMDSCDVVFDNKISKSTFIKPNEVRSNVTKDASSRCASPCSVLSSDDFIGQTDRSRLLEDNCMADDQDLVLLTADVDSVMQPPKSQSNNLKQANPVAKNSAPDEVICTAEFTAPLSTSTIAAVTESIHTLQSQNKERENYCVDQTEFRAMDVYESESDITDSVYSKGTNRVRTIINAVDTSSEEDDVQQTSSSQKVKRFCKRRTSSSNRGSDAHNDDASTDDDMDDGVSKTGVPFILRGNAVERNNKKLRKSIKPLNTRRVSARGVGNTSGKMSDTEFIATLNSLVQGREDEPNKETGEEKGAQDESGDDMLPNNNTQCDTVAEEKLLSPLASDQESLQSVEIVEKTALPASFAQAVPDDAVTGLDKIFDSIDNMPETTFNKNENEYEYSSDDEVEVIQPPVQISTNAEQIENQHALPIRHIVYNEQNLQQSGLGWNEEMVKFYNFSWHGERFTLVGLQNGMERDPKLWKIYSEDRFPKSRPYSNLKCYNCCEFGHVRAKCRRPKKPPICYMCGESGHFEPRCPNTICLRCGNKTQVFTKSCNACTFQNRLICPICKVRGHSINLCPDKWRRYHSTTQPNAYPNSEIEFNKRKMCCVCGANGHFSDTCRSALRFMQYPVIVSHVKSHQKSYSDLLLKSPHTGIALNLLYKPRDAAVFQMAKKTTPNGYYARFLKAVGLGNLLRRKRTSKCLAAPEKPSKQARSLSEHVERNTCGMGTPSTKGNVGNRNIAPTAEVAPNQVQEVSGSVTIAEAVTSDGLDVSAAEVMNTECTSNTSENDTNNVKQADADKPVTDSGTEFKAPSDAPTSTISHQLSQNKDNLTVDSDSNYSFSDHFAIPLDDIASKGEMISDESALDAQPSTSAAAKSLEMEKRVREMDPLPDFIPLMDSSDVNTDKTDMDKNFDTAIGISRCFVTTETDDENESNDAEKPDAPCEAKIYLTNFHSNYLLTPAGHEFLVHNSKECNITARLDWTSVGHVLVIFGLPSDQDTFHNALIQKCRELMDHMNNRQLSSIKVPKRIDALIRFLRENLSQLQSDLGDVNDLQKRIMNLEKTHTKANMKLAEKFRRLLNMILVGQAGLCDGDKYLDKLLVNLKSLINDYQSQNMVPQSLREEIDSHSKMIFTSYRHENYPELIQTYNRMSKSRKLSLSIDPLLLGEKMLDVILTAEQRARLEQPQTATGAVLQMNQTSSAKESTDNESNAPSSNNSKLGNKQKDLWQQSQPSKQSQQPLLKSKNSTPNATPNQSLSEIVSTRAKSSASTPTKRQTVASPPFINPQQKSTVPTKVKESVQHRQSALDDILNYDVSPSAGGNFKIQTQSPSGTGNAKRAPSKGPSVFWSRESMRYLDVCIQMAESNTELLLKLQRIQTKAAEGALSYNDYRAVIKLHGAMVGY